MEIELLAVTRFDGDGPGRGQKIVALANIRTGAVIVVGVALIQGSFGRYSLMLPDGVLWANDEDLNRVIIEVCERYRRLCQEQCDET